MQSVYQQIKNLTPAEKFVYEFETRISLVEIVLNQMRFRLFVKAAKKREQKRKEQEHELNS